MTAACRPPRRPNILMVIADDQGMNDAGCYGHPLLRTPALDELAAGGVRMTHAFCTSPSCSASRSVILTGLHNHANGQFGHSQPPYNFSTLPTVHSLPAMLGQAGYRTALCGKCHVAPDAVYPFATVINKDYSAGIGMPADMADACRAVIADPGANPFFLVFAMREPHRPFWLREQSRWRPEQVIVPSFLPDSPECRAELAEYYASVEQADTGLARLIHILKETGHWDDTLVLYLSDNGIAFTGAKTNLYEPGIRLPLVVRNPFQEQHGHACAAMVSFTDLTPTILDFAQVPLPDGVVLHGRSFLAALHAEAPAGWDEVYASHSFHEVQMYYPMRALRERRLKLIWNIAHPLTFPAAADLYHSQTWQAVLRDHAAFFGPRSVEAYLHRPAWELYDLETDPDEVRNLANNPHYQAALVRMQNKLRAFMEQTNDPWMTKWTYE